MPPPGVGNAELNSFWTDPPFGHEYGKFHLAPRDGSTYVPGLLIVFVHGINSAPEACWGDLPVRLLREVDADCDVLSFQFPSGLLRRSSIGQAAAALQTVIRSGTDTRYEDFIFVAHSAGGLVVKQLMVMEGASGEILRATRQIINLGVPHAGSMPGTSEWGRRLVVGVELLLSPVTHLVRFASFGKLGLGRNQIFCQLKHRGRFVLNLEEKYVALIRSCDDTKLARPVSVDLSAEYDVVAQGRGRQVEPGVIATTDRDHVAVRATHTSFKASALAFKLIKDNFPVDQIWEGRRRQFDRFLARGSIYRVDLIERSTGVESLLPGSELGTGPTRGQQWALDHLREITREPASSPLKVIVTGPMGVGKSVVLRRWVGDESRRFLESQAASPPMFFPVDRMSVGNIKGSGDDLWTALARAWIQLVNELLAAAHIPEAVDRPVTLSWMRDRLQREDNLIVLDGVDEFLANHPNLRVQDFNAALAQAQKEAAGRNPVFVLAIRQSFFGLDALAGHDAERILLAPVDVQTASRLLPGLEERIASLADADREAVLSPLVLTALQRTRHLPTRASAPAIIQEAMESLLRWNHLSGRVQGLAPLSLLGWAFYRKFRRELTIEEVLEGTAELHGRWERFSKSRPGTNGSSRRLEDLLGGFDTLRSPDTLRLILERCFFFPTAERTYAFSHEAWRDFLVTLYLSLCIRYQNITELGKVAFRVDHHERAGELLYDFQVEEDLVSSVIAETSRQKDRFIVGNFVGLLGISRVPLSPAAARLMVRNCENLDPLATFVALGRLGGRGLAAREDDVAAPDLRAALLDSMPKVLAIPGCSNLTASLCHCYSYAFKGVTGPRPRLDPEEVLNWVRDKARPEGEPTDDYRSLQLSYLYSQFTVAEHPERAVTTAHYLFLITAARVHGCGIAEVSERLPQLLGRGSALEKFFASYNRIPALFEIYQDCRALWESFAK